MYYHVRITQKSRRTSSETKLDLSIEELTQRILEPYRRGRPITIGGKSIAPDDIERLRINRTDRVSDDIRPQAEQARRSSMVVGIPTEWYIADSGEDVTDQFVTGPPGSEANAAVGDADRPTRTVNESEVFVVYGRNSEARDALFTFLRSIGLHPLEWSEAVTATGKPTPYVGEILDAAFSRAGAVVVLLTPDDEARLKEPFRTQHDPPYERDLSGQARPNVLFEAGMAMGRSHERTVLVELGALRPFSDIAGRHTIRIDDTSQRRQELVQRLESAGCSVNLGGTDWHTAGVFGAALGR